MPPTWWACRKHGSRWQMPSFWWPPVPSPTVPTDAINAAIADVQAGRTGPIPRQLQNKHCDGEDALVKGQNYKYAHDYDHHWVEQQYLPDAIKDVKYYTFGDNKNEQAARAYWAKIKGEENV